MTTRNRKLYLVEQIDANRAALATSIDELESKFTEPLRKFHEVKDKLTDVDPKIWKGTGIAIVGLWTVKKVWGFFREEPTRMERVAERKEKKGIFKGLVVSSLIALAKPYARSFLIKKASGVVSNYYASKSSRY